MSGFNSTFYEPKFHMGLNGPSLVHSPTYTQMPFGRPPHEPWPQSLDPSGTYLGPNARPCGGIGGYDAAAKEGRRLMEAGWNSVTTNDIHETWRNKRRKDTPNVYEPPQLIKERAESTFENYMRQQREEENKRIARETYARERYLQTILEKAVIASRRGPETVFENTGSSHFSYVEPGPKSRRPGWHETTYPGIGSKAGFSAEEFPSGYGIRTHISFDKKGNLIFDVNY